MARRSGGQRLAALSALIMLTGTACSGDAEVQAGPEPEPSAAPTPATESTSDAPSSPTPTPTAPDPEEEAAAEITAQFENTIAELDDFYQNAAEWAPTVSTPGWNDDFVDNQARFAGDASSDLYESMSAFINSNVEQVGSKSVHDFRILNLSTDGRTGTASSTACVDQSGLEWQDYSGSAREVDAPLGVKWDVDWQRYDNEEDERTIPRDGWYITSASFDLSVNC